MLRIDPAQRHRLEEIGDNLQARITEAQREGWTGEAEGLKVGLDAANNKIAQADLSAARRAEAIDLGIPAYRDLAAAAVTTGGPMTADDLAATLHTCAAGIPPYPPKPASPARNLASEEAGPTPWEAFKPGQRAGSYFRGVRILYGSPFASAYSNARTIAGIPASRTMTRSPQWKY